MATIAKESDFTAAIGVHLKFVNGRSRFITFCPVHDPYEDGHGITRHGKPLFPFHRKYFSGRATRTDS